MGTQFNSAVIEKLEVSKLDGDSGDSIWGYIMQALADHEEEVALQGLWEGFEEF